MPTGTTVAATTAAPTHFNGLEVAHYKPGDPLPLTPTIAAVQVTPALAQDWLDRYSDPKKRTIRPKKVAEYADDMKRGGWLWGTSTIAFTANGGVTLDNGHHRLTAIVQSGASVWMLVLTGAEPAIRSVTDIGISRTGGDNIKMWGGKDYANEIASFIKMVLINNQTVGTSIAWRPPNGGTPGIVTPMKRLIVETWQADEVRWHTVAHTVKAGRKYIPLGVPPKTVGAFVYFAEIKYPGEGVKFFQDLTAGGHPETLRDLIQITKTRPTTSGTQLEYDRKIMEFLIRSFNASRVGKVAKVPHRAFNLSQIK